MPGQPVASDRAVVVEAQQGDHVANIGLGFDSSRGWSRLVGKHRVGHDATLLSQLGPDLLGEAETGGVVTVQVSELAAGEPEAELAAATMAGLNPARL